MMIWKTRYDENTFLNKINSKSGVVFSQNTIDAYNFPST